MKRQRLIFGVISFLLLTLLCRTDAIPADGTAEISEPTKYIALTFDDGPSATTTARLLDGLRERGASATFFLVGERIEANRDLVLRMKREGHQVGNHTWSHVALEKATPDTIRSEITRTETKLQEILGEGSYWLRPPYGTLNSSQKALIHTPLIQWSVDPRDWEKRDTPKVVQAVLHAAQPNAIILLHDIYTPSVDAALQIVDALEAKGYVFVTVEELLALNGVEAKPGVFYCSGSKG